MIGINNFSEIVLTSSEVKKLLKINSKQYETMIAGGELCKSTDICPFKPDRLRMHTPWDVLHFRLQQVLATHSEKKFPEFISELLDSIASAAEYKTDNGAIIDEADLTYLAEIEEYFNDIVKESDQALKRTVKKRIIDAILVNITMLTNEMNYMLA